MTQEDCIEKVEMWAKICDIPDEDITPAREKAAKGFLEIADGCNDDEIEILIILMTIMVAYHPLLVMDPKGAITPIAKVLFALNQMHKDEIAALKDKYRWRKQSEEPAPKDVLVEVYLPSPQILDFVRPNATDDYVRAGEYWRPLDVPETEGTK